MDRHTFPDAEDGRAIKPPITEFWRGESQYGDEKDVWGREIIHELIQNRVSPWSWTKNSRE